MTEQQQEQNITIARYMGISGTDQIIVANYRYDKYWDLLMPVWIKLRKEIDEDNEPHESIIGALSYALYYASEPSDFSKALAQQIEYYNSWKYEKNQP